METKENNKFSWLKNSIGLKISIIGFIILLMLIPSGMIKDLMYERQGRLREAIREVTSKWGEEQTITGPILTVPCIETIKKGKKEVYQTRYLTILPDELKINGEIFDNHLHRGIFDILVYNSKLEFSGYFDSSSLPTSEFRDCDLLWDKATLGLGIHDPKGINKNIAIKWNNTDIKTIPGTAESPILNKGIHSPLKIDPTKKYAFSFSLDINGSGMLNFVPVGKETFVNLTSSWQHPQFDGSYIPKTRHIDENGFKANWVVLEHNREFPQMWLGGMSIKDASFGVELIEPVDVYQKSIRAVKYSMLFIILTFLAFLFSELIIKRKAHPIQYIMVGAALCVFFSLLIALSEHLHFNMAYVIASITIIGMISLFSKSVFQDLKISGIVLLVLVILFIFLFVILQMADLSLVLGNIGLVVALAIVMFISRKIDWYNEKNTQDE